VVVKTWAWAARTRNEVVLPAPPFCLPANTYTELHETSFLYNNLLLRDKTKPRP